MENTLLTPEKISSILLHANHRPPGLFAECGVYKGGMTKLLAKHYPERTIIGFDTFAGLPVEHWTENEVHQPKDFDDVSVESVAQFINLPNVTLVKGLFPESAAQYTEEVFAFVHVDFDFYLGIKACLEFFWPRLVSKGCMVFDDYGWPRCPGVKQALDEFCKLYSETAPFQATIIKP